MNLINKILNGGLIYRVPAATDGDADAGASAAEDGSSDKMNEYEMLHEEFESATDHVSNDDAKKEADGTTEAEVEEEGRTDEESDAADESDTEVEEEDTGEESDNKDDTAEEREADGEEEEEKPEPLTDEQLSEMRTSYIDDVAKSIVIDEDTADQLRAEPEKALPRLLAQREVETLERMVTLIRDTVPQLVNQQIQVQNTGSQLEKQFFAKFGELNTKKGRKIVESLAQTYRKANPKATTEEAIDNVGFMAWRQAGLPLEKLASKMGIGEMEETFVGSGKGAKGAKDKGHKPTISGKAADRVAGRTQELNEFEKIAESLMQDDRDI